MLSIILTCVLVSAFFAIEFFSGKYAAEEKTLKVTRPLSILLNVAPLAGILIFSVLFAFVLKGQLWERISHAVFVLAAWMYATRFYLILLSHFKKKRVVASCLVGMVYAVALAVYFTPLNRYVALPYALMNRYSVFLGCGLLIVFYAMTILDHIRKKAMNHAAI